MKQVEFNNARIVCSEDYIAVYGIECVDEKQSLWRGDIIPNMRASKQMKDSEAYFLRNRETNYPEAHIKDESVVGAEFWLVPFENVLFGYESPSTILKPKIRLS